MDAAFVPFIERFQIYLKEVFKYDIIPGRPRLAAYIEVFIKMFLSLYTNIYVLGSDNNLDDTDVQELNKIDAYKQTKCDPNWLIQFYNKQFLVVSHSILHFQT